MMGQPPLVSRKPLPYPYPTLKNPRKTLEIPYISKTPTVQKMDNPKNEKLKLVNK